MGDHEHKESAAHFLDICIFWFTNIMMKDSVVWLEKMSQNLAMILFLSQMTTTQEKGKECMGNQTFSQWANEKKRDIMFMIKARAESEEVKWLTNATIVQKLICQNELMLEAIS